MHFGFTSTIDRSRAIWWVLGVAIFVVLAFVADAFLGTFMLGLFLYYATRPVYSRIRGRIGQPSIGAAVALLVLSLPVVLLVNYTVLIAVQELSAFVGQNQQGILAALKPYLGSFESLQAPSELLATLLENPGELVDMTDTATVEAVLSSIAGTASFILDAAFQLFIAFAFAFYLLRDDRRLAGWTRENLSGHGGVMDAYMTAVDRDLRTIYFGNILNAFAIAVIAAVSYNAINLFAPPSLWIPSPTLLGALTGAASLIPVVGMKIVYIPVTVLLAVEAALTAPDAFWVALAYGAVSLVVVDTIPDFLLRPYVSGRNLHTGTVMFAYIIGPALFGWYGLFLGPLLLVIAVHFVRIVLPELVTGEPLKPDARGRNPLSAIDDEQQKISDFEATSTADD
ncbi:AI-2E family transporter [Halogeometricum borinquense]|uniref:AI-2E family transporter n=1 Tax=Halogeometricum borinquense TaxID=60847 RepID=A0A6C0UKU8_9EURY|nr:AI-2E family transporter [Halogeometricum borinquense]QIB76132.1 AI-2E family transporter [Halogeometricum borinquense]QIQ75432.1 AI-2E family transporter [Halogeometricum borinquense]